MKEYIDNLTELNNMLFLFENYNSYINEHEITYMVSIDFQKLKYINDNFGHAVGDVCIMTFSDLIKVYFERSLLIRRSGDEFLIITTKPVEDIIKKLQKVSGGIDLAFEKKIIPISFKFNSGIKKCEFDLKETLFKADITMYRAKQEGKMIEYYQEEFLTSIKDKENFIKNIDSHIFGKKFTYAKQNLYDLNKNKANIFEIYTRDKNGECILNNENLTSLKTNFRLKRVDLLNIDLLFKSEVLKNEKYIINIHFQTLLSHEYDFIELISKKIISDSIVPKNICFSINIIDYAGDVAKLSNIINNLKKLGFTIELDGFSFNNKVCVISFLSLSNIDYIKINKEVFVQAMKDRSFNVILQYMVKMFITLGLKPIFSNVENEEEFNFIKKIDERSLIKGYYLEKDTRLEI